MTVAREAFAHGSPESLRDAVSGARHHIFTCLSHRLIAKSIVSKSRDPDIGHEHQLQKLVGFMKELEDMLIAKNVHGKRNVPYAVFRREASRLIYDKPLNMWDATDREKLKRFVYQKRNRLNYVRQTLGSYDHANYSSPRIGTTSLVRPRTPSPTPSPRPSPWGRTPP